MNKYIKYVLYALVIGYVAFLGIRYLNGWSSPTQMQEKIDIAIRQDRRDHVFFEDRDALWAYVEEHGYIKYDSDVFETVCEEAYDEGYEAGYENGHIDGYKEGFEDGYWEGYEDCNAGIPYQDPYDYPMPELPQ